MPKVEFIKPIFQIFSGWGWYSSPGGASKFGVPKPNILQVNHCLYINTHTHTQCDWLLKSKNSLSTFANEG